jgi:hypothetical protein
MWLPIPVQCFIVKSLRIGDKDSTNCSSIFYTIRMQDMHDQRIYIVFESKTRARAYFTETYRTTN